MSLTKLFAIHDKKAAAFMPPLTFKTLGQAERAFGDAVRAPDSDFGKHPEDYSMHLIGEFDETLGNVIPMKEGTQVIAMALNFLDRETLIKKA